MKPILIFHTQTNLAITTIDVMAICFRNIKKLYILHCKFYASSLDDSFGTCSISDIWIHYHIHIIVFVQNLYLNNTPTNKISMTVNKFSNDIWRFVANDETRVNIS